MSNFNDVKTFMHAFGQEVKVKAKFPNEKIIFKDTRSFITFLNSKIKKNGTKAIKPRNILPAIKEKGPI